MVKETENDKKQNRSWLARRWKFILLLLIAFVFLLLLLIPHFYSNRIFQPIIKDTFHNLTHDKYYLDFKDVSWSILKNSFSVHDIRIIPFEEDSIVLTKKNTIKVLELESIEINGIKYSSLFNGEVRLKYLGLDGLNILMNNELTEDTLKAAVKPKTVISDFLTSILISKFEIENADVSILNGNDSLICIKNIDFTLGDLYIDSLDFLVDSRIPHFETVSMNLKKSLFNEGNSDFFLSDFMFSAGQQFNRSNIEFAQLKIINNKNKNITLLNRAKIEIELMNFYHGLKHRDFHFPSVNIHLNSLENKTVKQKELDVNNLIQRLQEGIVKLKTELILDSLVINIDTMVNHSPKQNIELVDFMFKLSGSQIKNGEYIYTNYFISSGNIEYKSAKTKDVLSLQSISYDESNRSMFINDIDFRNNISSTTFSLKNADIKQINLLSSLRDKKIVIDYLFLNQPQLLVLEQHTPPLKKSPTKIAWDIDIKQIELDEFDVELRTHGFKMDNCVALFDSLKILSNRNIDWKQLVKNFSFTFDQIKYNPPTKKLDVLMENSKFQSSNGRLNMARFQIDLKQEIGNNTQILAEEVLLSGIDWKTLSEKRAPIMMDTIMLNYLSFNAFLEESSDADKTPLDSLFYFECGYIKMPYVQIDIDMLKEKQLSHLNLHQLSVEAKDFSLNMSSEEILAYDKLRFSSLKTLFQHSSDSAVLHINNWTLDMGNQVFAAEGINVSLLTSDSVKQLKGRIDFSLPSIYISGIDPIDYKLNNAIVLDSLMLNQPELLFNSRKGNKIKQSKDPKKSLETFKQIASKFSRISFNHFIISGLKLTLKNHTVNRYDELGIGRADIGIHGFYIDQEKLNSMEKFLFSNEFSLSLNDYKQSINNGQHIVSFKEVKASKVDNQLSFKEFKLLSLMESSGTPMNIFIQDIQFKDFALNTQLYKPDLSIGSILFNSSTLQIRSSKKKDEKNIDIEEMNLFPMISPYFSSVAIDELKLHNLDLKLPDVQIANQNNIELSGINLQVNNFRLDSNNRLFTEEKFLYSDLVLLHLPSFKMRTTDQFYDIGFSKLSFNSQQKTLNIDSLEVIPIYDKKLFSAYIKYQKARLELIIPRIDVESFDLHEIIFGEKYNVQKIILANPSIAFYKDKTVTVDTSVYKLMPAQMLQELPFYLNIDTVDIINGKLQYEELSSNMPQPGFIYFDKLAGRVTGITNDANIRHSGGVLTLTAYAHVMSNSLVTLNSTFPLNSLDQDFTIKASMGPILASDFNPIIEPLTMIIAKDGNIKQMQMNVKGNNDYGVGEMILKYKDLKIDVLKKENLEGRQLVSFLANTMFVKTNNKSIFGPRKGSIYFERITYRGVFNYITRFAIIGAKTSIGIDERKTRREIKSIK